MVAVSVASAGVLPPVVASAGVLPPAVAAGNDMVSGDCAGVPSLVFSDHALLRAKNALRKFRESSWAAGLFGSSAGRYRYSNDAADLLRSLGALVML